MIYSEDFECIEKMEIKRYDKNSFHLPRQYMPFDNGDVLKGCKGFLKEIGIQ